MSIYEELSDILEEEVSEDTVLADCEMWDSLATMSIVALAASKYKKGLTIDTVKNLVTVKDIVNAIQS
jgi:acyl carrier protein